MLKLGSSQSALLTFVGASNLISGTMNDGVFQSTLTVPQFSDVGTWQIYDMFIYDAAGNSAYLRTSDLASMGIATDITVTGTSDTTPPTLESLSFAPATIDTGSSDQSVTFTWHLKDDGGGILTDSGNPNPYLQPVMLSVQSPSGIGLISTVKASGLVSGNLNDGIFQSTLTFPRLSETGTWKINGAFLTDTLGNSTFLSTTDLANMGIATDITVLGTPGATTTGTNVVVWPVDSTTSATPLKLTFSEITQAGTTTLTTSNTGPAGNFTLGTPPIYYDIATTAQYVAPVQVCITYNASQFTDPSNLQLMHYDGTSWQALASSNNVAISEICANTNSLSPFAIAQETATATSTPTATYTPSDTPTYTETPTDTPTATLTPSDTPTYTLTPSDTPTDTPTLTLTPSDTPTYTLTPSDTPTATLTPSGTPTYTLTPSDTPTATLTPSDTPTYTDTPTDTPTLTLTPSDTPTYTLTPSDTPTATLTPSDTPTYTDTPTDTPTLTLTPSDTPTYTLTPSDTPTYTLTPTDTPTLTLTPSDTPTYTLTPSDTPTATLTPSDTPTDTPTATFTPTLTATPSNTPTASNTPTSTGTVTATKKPTNTLVPSPTPKPTNTIVPTNTKVPTNTLVPSPTPKPTNTLVPSKTPVPTATSGAMSMSANGVAASTPTATLAGQIVESNSSAVSRSGNWTEQATSNASGGSYSYSSGAAGDSLTLNFTGSQFDVVYVEHPALGTFAIDVDGTTLNSVVETNSTTTFGVRASIYGLTSGAHTLRVYAVSGTIAIDAFVLDPAGTIILPTATATPIPTLTPSATVVIPSSTPTATPLIASPTLIPTVPPTSTAFIPSVTPTTAVTLQPATLTPSPLVLPINENMDDGTPLWTGTGTWTLTNGGPSGTGKMWAGLPSASLSVLSFNRSVSLSGATYPTLQFQSALADPVTAQVQISLDAQTWQPLSTVAPTTSWTLEPIDLSAYKNQVIWLRFVWSGTNSTALWQLDNVQIADLPPTAVPTLVSSIPGLTSTATPTPVMATAAPSPTSGSPVPVPTILPTATAAFVPLPPAP